MHAILLICTLLTCFTICECENENKTCSNLSDIGDVLMTAISDFEMMIFNDNETVNLCSMYTGCQCYNAIFENNNFHQIKPIILPKGISMNISMYSNETIQLYKITKLEEFMSCQLNNETSNVNLSNTVNGIQVESLSIGSHLFICNNQNESEMTCQNGCRLNITIKENKCKNRNSSHVCNGNGNCTSLQNETHFTCKCFDGFCGSICETNNSEDDNLSICADSDCRNGGTCVSKESMSSTENISSSTCVCPPHFTGKYCETLLNNCKSSPCVNGVCVEHIDGYQCYCVPGFHGKNCELEYNECLSNPCDNRGTCIDRVDKFECRCSVGYKGSTCQEKDDICHPSPCHMNSTCTSIHEAFHCICNHGFTGQFCDEKIKSCSSNPCKNHGTCIEYETGYQCMCQVTFAGLHCEYMMDVFAPPMEGADLSGESHKHNMYIVAGILGSMVLIVLSVIVACYCKVYETYKQLMWKRLRYQRKRSNSCPDLETCNEPEPNYIGKHRLSADAIWEATSLCHENAAFENSTNHQTFTSMQI